MRLSSGSVVLSCDLQKWWRLAEKSSSSVYRLLTPGIKMYSSDSLAADVKRFDGRRLVLLCFSFLSFVSSSLVSKVGGGRWHWSFSRDFSVVDSWSVLSFLPPLLCCLSLFGGAAGGVTQDVPDQRCNMQQVQLCFLRLLCDLLIFWRKTSQFSHEQRRPQISCRLAHYLHIICLFNHAWCTRRVEFITSGSSESGTFPSQR